MIQKTSEGILLSLDDLNKSLLATYLSFGVKNSTFMLDYRKELINLVQIWDILLRKVLVVEGVISKVDDRFYSYTLEDLYLSFKETSLGQGCIRHLESTALIANPLSTFATLSSLDVQYKSKSNSFYSLIPYSDIIHSLQLVIGFLRSNGVV